MLKSAVVMDNFNSRKAQYIKLTLLYVLLTAGGLWHILGWFTTLMRVTAAPLMMVLSAWIILEFWFYNGGRAARDIWLRFIIWSAAVMVLSLVVEDIGVRTGQIFGVYFYGKTLQPFVGAVPLAIGFAWFNMLLGSLALWQRIGVNLSRRPWLTALFVGISMVLFDMIMEPAAMRLGYWYWQDQSVPLQNYLAWFVLGYIFAYVGLKIRIFDKGVPDMARHIFQAQFIYFVMVNLWNARSLTG